MDRFVTHSGIAAPMIIPNVTTDAISPSKANVSATQDLGVLLFADWRYNLDGSEKPDFILNRDPFRAATILVGGPNFGCGSSRERAVWALRKFGIRCVIAPSFGDIFRSNCYQNGLLPIELSGEALESVQAFVAADPRPTLAIDLQQGTVSLPNGTTFDFAIPDDRRDALLEGLDEIDILLRMEPGILKFQETDRLKHPWIYHPR